MRQASLKFKMYMGNVNIIDNNNLSNRIFHMMLASFGVLALCYVFILANMVFNIIARKSLEKEVLSISNEVGNLELSYLDLSNKVDLNFSHTLGFREIKPTYAVRKTLGFGYPINTSKANEI